MPAESERAKLLLEVGVAALAKDGNFTLAEACFLESKRLAEDPETRSKARLSLASLFVMQYLPGVRAEDAEENAEWLGKAEREYFEVLDSVPFASTEQIDSAISGLGSLVVFRRPTPNVLEV